jgi:hypothetical protein
MAKVRAKSHLHDNPVSPSVSNASHFCDTRSSESGLATSSRVPVAGTCGGVLLTPYKAPHGALSDGVARPRSVWWGARGASTSPGRCQGVVIDSLAHRTARRDLLTDQPAFAFAISAAEPEEAPCWSNLASVYAPTRFRRGVQMTSNARHDRSN